MSTPAHATSVLYSKVTASPSNCTAFFLSPFTSQSFIFYCCSSTIPYCPCASRSLLLPVVNFNPGNRGQHSTFLFPKQSLSCLCTSRSFTLRHITQTDTHSSAGRLLTLPTNSSTIIHRSTHKTSHQHAFSPRHRRSHRGAVRPAYFDSLSCLCSSHLSCTSSGIFILLDGDH